MKATNVQRPVMRLALRSRPNVLQMPKTGCAYPSVNRTDNNDKLANQIVGVTSALVIGLFALWVSLTILGSIGLGNLDNEALHSLSLRIVIASGIAMVLCIVALPFYLPWVLAFFAAYFFIPSRSALWKPLACPIAGVLVGMLALWTDAMIYTLSTGESVSSLNISLLEVATIPAAVLGGAICFAAAASAVRDARKSVPASK